MKRLTTIVAMTFVTCGMTTLMALVLMTFGLHTMLAKPVAGGPAVETATEQQAPPATKVALSETLPLNTP